MPAKRGRPPLVAVLTTLALSLAGCDGVVQAVADGMYDFIESTTANLLEQAFPLPESQEGGS